jgi:type III pantothenate kinase
MASNERLLLVDMGNHSIKAALSRSGSIAQRWRYERGGGDLAISALLDEAEPDAVAYCCVVPKLGMVLQKELERREIADHIEVTSDIKLPFDVKINNPGTLGTDRIAAAAGAVALGHTDAIIVDAGTAVTVDVLTSEGFLGGSIFPGLEMLTGSLHSRTASLPDIKLGADPPPTPGDDTVRAIASGAFWGFIGAAKELIERSSRELKKSSPILLTGGNAEFLMPHLDTQVMHTPDLVFHGLELIYKLNK